MIQRELIGLPPVPGKDVVDDFGGVYRYVGSDVYERYGDRIGWLELLESVGDVRVVYREKGDYEVGERVNAVELFNLPVGTVVRTVGAVDGDTEWTVGVRSVRLNEREGVSLMYWNVVHLFAGETKAVFEIVELGVENG